MADAVMVKANIAILPILKLIDFISGPIHFKPSVSSHIFSLPIKQLFNQICFGQGGFAGDGKPNLKQKGRPLRVTLL
jgi:hypothetical protein